MRGLEVALSLMMLDDDVSFAASTPTAWDRLLTFVELGMNANHEGVQHSDTTC